MDSSPSLKSSILPKELLQTNDVLGSIHNPSNPLLDHKELSVTVNEEIREEPIKGVKRKSSSTTLVTTKRPKFDQDQTNLKYEALELFLKLNHGFLDGEDLIKLALVSKKLYQYCSQTTLWSYVCLKNVDTLRGHLGAVNVITILDNFAFSGSSDGKIKLWDVDRWECLRTLNMTQPVYAKHIRPGNIVGAREVAMPSAITALEAKDHRLFTGLEQGHVVMNKLIKRDEKSQHAKREHGHSGRVNCLKVCGDRLYSAGNDGKVSVFDATDLSPIKQLRPFHKRAVISLELCCNRLFSAGEDGNVMVWDTRSDKLPLIAILTPPGVNFQIPYPHQPNTIKMDMTHSQKISCMCSYKDKLFTSGWDCILKLWDCNTLTMLKEVFLNPLSICWAMNVRETNNLKPHLLCSVRDCEVELRSVEDLYLIQGTTGKNCNWSKGNGGHQSWINTILCLKDGRVITGSDDWTIKVWDVINSKNKEKFDGLRDKVSKKLAKQREYLRGLISGEIDEEEAKNRLTNDSDTEKETKTEEEQPIIKQETETSSTAITSLPVLNNTTTTNTTQSKEPIPKKEVPI